MHTKQLTKIRLMEKNGLPLVACCASEQHVQRTSPQLRLQFGKLYAQILMNHRITHGFLLVMLFFRESASLSLQYG